MPAHETDGGYHELTRLISAIGERIGRVETGIGALEDRLESFDGRLRAVETGHSGHVDACGVRYDTLREAITQGGRDRDAFRVEMREDLKATREALNTGLEQLRQALSDGKTKAGGWVIAGLGTVAMALATAIGVLVLPHLVGR